MLRFRCPHCDHKLKAPDEDAGTQQACPKCRKMMTVPGLVAPNDMMTSRGLDAAFLIEKYVVHNDYEEQHRDIFNCVKNQSKAIAELMIFHGWTTQFGVRISSSYPEKSDALVSELVYLANQRCPFTLAIYHGVRFAGLPAEFVEQIKDVKFAYSSPIEFGSTLDARWQEYDSIYLRCRWEDEIFAHSAICEGVIKNCEIDTTQPSALLLRMVLSVWYLNRLSEIQGDAIQGGLLVKA
jgi:hypothetical protein